MKRSEAIEICLEHCGCEDINDFMEQMTCDSIHNVGICLGCEDTFDMEPDGATGESPCCEGKIYVTLTKLYGIDI